MDQQYVYIHALPRGPPSPPPSRLSRSPQAIPCAIEHLPSSYIIHGVGICQHYSPNSSHAPLPRHVHTSVCYVCIYPALELIHLYQFSRSHIPELICNTCFSLSDLVHSIWQTLALSTSWLPFWHKSIPSGGSLVLCLLPQYLVRYLSWTNAGFSLGGVQGG